MQAMPIRKTVEYQIQILSDEGNGWLPVLLTETGHAIGDYWYSDRAEVAQDAQRLRHRFTPDDVRVVRREIVVETTEL